MYIIILYDYIVLHIYDVRLSFFGGTEKVMWDIRIFSSHRTGNYELQGSSKSWMIGISKSAIHEWDSLCRSRRVHQANWKSLSAHRWLKFLRFSTRIYQVPWRVQFVMVEGCLKVGAYLQVTGILNIIFIGNMIAWHWLTSGFGQTLILIWLTLLDIAERPQIWDPSGSFASVPGAETHELCNADQLSGTRAGLHEDVEGQQWTHRDGSSFKLGGQTISKLISKPFTFTRNTRNMFSWMIVPW